MCAERRGGLEKAGTLGQGSRDHQCTQLRRSMFFLNVANLTYRLLHHGVRAGVATAHTVFPHYVVP